MERRVYEAGESGEVKDGFVLSVSEDQRQH